MIGDKIPELSIEIYREMPMPDGGSIVLADPIGEKWESIDLQNHNVFRLDKDKKLIWRISRNENGYINWEARNKNPTLFNPFFSDGYQDRFVNFGRKFLVRHQIENPRPFHPKFTYEVFDSYALGRILWLSTCKYEYELDPETGIATCTGMPMK